MEIISLNSILESFYYCTHLPIKVIDSKGKEILKIGYNNESLKLFESIDINSTLIKSRASIENNGFIDIPVRFNEVFFTILPIDSVSCKKGIFVIGPYSINKEISHIVYKPAHCIHHLIKLLYSISEEIYKSKDFVKSTDSNTSYIVNYKINKAIDYINSNYENPITLKEISSSLNMNKSYFCNLFRTSTGKTFSSFLNSVRINKAKELLINTDLSITDIAFTVGFSSVNYFNLNFRKFENITPLQFRNKYYSS